MMSSLSLTLFLGAPGSEGAAVCGTTPGPLPVLGLAGPPQGPLTAALSVSLPRAGLDRRRHPDMLLAGSGVEYEV